MSEQKKLANKMTKNKQGLIGIIQEKSQKKYYNGSKRAGTHSYQLKVRIENKSVNKISVFQDKVSEKIWKSIEQNKFIDKRYLLQCINYMGQYHLADWEELKDYGKQR